ncbi:FkbM family methyltransferase [Dokdonella sp. MW10]|uniref:FkbM family methyltransferase n=1 Tax=Dokdonella sp. MW10 TaxID=2992926 RepID=UPI003F80A43E
MKASPQVASAPLLSSQACTSGQLKSPSFQRWMGEIHHAPMIMHRKLWEWAYIAQALEERGMLQPGKRGLGFAVGREPLVALFASKGCDIVASDLDPIAAHEAGWTSSNEHAHDVSVLNTKGLCPPDAFAERVSFRVVDMTEIADDLEGFDFLWSSCAIEHVGSLDATADVVSRMMHCLKPGGVAVHTTEYNIGSNDATTSRGPTVIPRRRDLEALLERLEAEGHRVAPLDFDIGSEADDKVILHPPYEGYPCLKIWLGDHATTSFGIVAVAGEAKDRASTPPPVRKPPPRAADHAWLRGLRNWFEPKASVPVASTSSNGASDPERDIALVYRLLLGRKPDAAGLAHFGGLMRSGADAEAIAAAIIQSDEFKNRHGRSGPAAASRVPVEMGGYTLVVPSGDRDIGSAIARGGAYEPHVDAVVRDQLRKGDTFLDIGANMGYFTMLAAHLVGPGGRVIAVEPLDKNLQCLYAGLEANAFEHVVVLPVGASDRAHLIPIITDEGTSNALVQAVPSKRRPSLYAYAHPLDALLGDVDRVDLVKIDIEGHEVFALRGAEALLARCRPRILTEFHPLAMRENSGIDARDYLGMIFAYAARVSIVTVDGRGLVPCADADRVMAAWSEYDARFSNGKGTFHLDLFVEPRQS